MAQENDADIIAHEVLEAIRRSFITPFDRSDIQTLIQSMDDAIDRMNGTVKMVRLYEVTAFEPNMQAIGKVVVEAALLLAEAVPLLERPGANVARLTELTEKIVEAEGRSDDLYDVGLIGVALLFDFLNGLHDAANSIATVVSTRVLSPQVAVAWAAFFNFIAFLFFGLHVANTIGTGIVDAGIVDASVIFAALVGAISWNVITWLLGIPSSSSHALIGGLLGAGITKAGIGSVVWSGVIKTTLGIFMAPILGMGVALALMILVAWLFRRLNASRSDRIFRRTQLFTAALYSLGHGGNDAQKTMGIIAVLLYSQGLLQGSFHVPFWVVLSCQAAMGLGTLMGGWRIVHTMGSRITRLTPHQGVCAELGGSIMLFGATWLGIPVSTTHTITGSIMGVGAARRASAVRWGVAGNIIIAWFITLPAAAAISALTLVATWIF
jgi:PiT family inorganic phosphate transporter